MTGRSQSGGGKESSIPPQGYGPLLYACRNTARVRVPRSHSLALLLLDARQPCDCLCGERIQCELELSNSMKLRFLATYGICFDNAKLEATVGSCGVGLTGSILLR